MRGIYKATNKINNKVYIGQSMNIDRRIKQHLRVSFEPNTKAYNHYFHRAIRKYGKENFEWKIIISNDNFTRQDLYDYELIFIIEYDSNNSNKGYNLSCGGDGGLNGETIEKIRKTNLTKYGVEHYTKTDEYKNRHKETSLKRYGVCHPSQNKEIAKSMSIGIHKAYQERGSEIRNHIEETNLKKYGVRNPIGEYAKTKECKQKKEQNGLVKYGVKYKGQLEEQRKRVSLFGVLKGRSKAIKEISSNKCFLLMEVANILGIDKHTFTENVRNGKYKDIYINTTKEELLENRKDLLSLSKEIKI